MVGMGDVTPARLMAHALLENAYGRSSSVPPAARLYPYETFLAWRLRDFSLGEILQVRREVKAGARQWAAAGKARSRRSRADTERRGEQGDDAGDMAATRRLALGLTRRAWHEAASRERLHRESLSLGVMQSQPGKPSAAPLPAASGLAPGAAKFGIKALAWKVETARRSLVPPELRPREIAKWLEALHDDLKYGLTWKVDPTSAPSVLVRPLRDLPPTTRNKLGSYAFSVREAETMLRAAERRRGLAEAMVVASLKGRCSLATVPRARDALVRLVEEVGQEINEAFPGEGSSAPDLAARQRSVEDRLRTALRALPADVRGLIVPRRGAETASAGSADQEDALGPGFWPRLERHWRPLEALVEAQDDLEAWAKVVATLEAAAETKSTLSGTR